MLHLYLLYRIQILIFIFWLENCNYAFILTQQIQFFHRLFFSKIMCVWVAEGRGYGNYKEGGVTHNAKGLIYKWEISTTLQTMVIYFLT